MSTSAPNISPVSDQEQAAHAAKLQYLQDQAVNFMRAVKNLQVNLILADGAQELSDPLKKHLYDELIKCASIVEVK